MNGTFTAVIPGPFDAAEQRVRQALADAGFGIITEIDVQKTLLEKLGVNFKRYKILGACKPDIAHAALSVDESVGLLLPCNVVLSEFGNTIAVTALRPSELLRIMPKSPATEIATAADAILERAFVALGSAHSE